MRTPILIIKTFVVILPLLVLQGDTFVSKIPKRTNQTNLIVAEPLQLKLLKIRHQVQQGEIILLQNNIESNLNKTTTIKQN